MHKKRTLLILFFCLIAFSACQNNYPNKATTENFCIILEDAINNGGSGFLNKTFDPEPLISVVTEGIDAPAEYEEGFMAGFQQAYSVGDILTSNNYNAYTAFLKLKKYKENSDTIIALFRTVSDLGINYQEVFLSADDEGQLHIFDLYSYFEGDYFSQSIRRLYIINLANESEVFTHPLAQNIPLINEIASLADKKQFAEAFQKLESIPPEVKKEKIVQLIRLGLANEISKATLQSVVADFKEQYPNDNLIYLKMMDIAFENKDKVQMLASIDSLDKAIGGDNYLKVLKAGVYKEDAQDELAERLLNESIAEDAYNDDAYWLLLDLLIVQKRYDKAIELFGDIQDNFDINPAEYVLYDGYTDFYRSAQFSRWINKHPIDSSTTILDGLGTPDSLFEYFDAIDGGHSH